MTVWDWAAGAVVCRVQACHVTPPGVFGCVFSPDGAAFVTYGPRHLKWWSREEQARHLRAAISLAPVSRPGRSASLLLRRKPPASTIAAHPARKSLFRSRARPDPPDPAGSRHPRRGRPNAPRAPGLRPAPGAAPLGARRRRRAAGHPLRRLPRGAPAAARLRHGRAAPPPPGLRHAPPASSFAAAVTPQPDRMRLVSAPVRRPSGWPDHHMGGAVAADRHQCSRGATSALSPLLLSD